MKKLSKYYAMIIATAITASSSPASAIDIAVGPKISTLGVGIEATTKLSDQFNIRLGANFFKYNRNVPNGKVDYKGRLRMLTISGLVDFHPWSNGFRISAGAMYNGNKVDMKATPNQAITVGGFNLTPADIGTAKTTIDF